ncbi:MAG TPA: hypothetical protein VNM47_17170, partial [Terriglobia bacterium]|nr:hypothetical protein [Terriglobia bacterium]
MTLAAGTKLGVYEIISPLGAGGMGEVEPFCGREPFAVILSGAKNLLLFSAEHPLRGTPQAKSRVQRGI